MQPRELFKFFSTPITVPLPEATTLKSSPYRLSKSTP